HHYRESPRQNRCTPKAGAYCENGVVSAAGRPIELPESGRSKESGEAISPPDACDFPATADVALPDARVRDYPVAGINAQLESEPLVPGACQPLGAMARSVDARARTGNGPTSVHRFDSIHHPSHILGDGQIAPPQLF